MDKTYRDFGIDVPAFFHGEIAAICPKCSSDRKKAKNKCLSVNGDKRTWHCNHCGWSGGLPEERIMPAPERRFRRPTPPPKTEVETIDRRIVAYFQGRGISSATLEKAKVYSTVHYLPGTGAETLCMAFPYYRDGVLVNVKYRDAKKNMSQEKDPEPCLWNVDAVKASEVVYITEGEIDALTLIECGFAAAVSVDKGAPSPADQTCDKKLECVTNCLDLLDGKSIVLVTDKDAPGIRLEQELIARLGANRCRLAAYPDGCKDINDVMVKVGRGAVITAVTTAAPVPIPGLYSVSSAMDAVTEYWRKGKPKKLSTGWPELDAVFGIQPGSVNVITGIPTAGKSEFLHQLLVNMMSIHNWTCAVFSPEMLPVEDLMANFVEKIVGKSFLGAPETRASYDEVANAMRYLDQHLKLVLPDADKTPDLDWILGVAQSCIERFGIKILSIDPYNELEHARPDGMLENDYVSAFMSKLRRFARQNKIVVLLVAHPTKLKKDTKTGKFPVPNLYDVCGSSNFANKTDNGIALWRDIDKKDNTVFVHLLKVKNKTVGVTGASVKFWWNRENGRFTPYTYEKRYSDEDVPDRE